MMEDDEIEQLFQFEEVPIEVDEASPEFDENGFQFFKEFPLDLMKDIWKYLPYRDAQNFRRVNKVISMDYHENRRYIDGPICEIVIDAEGYLWLEELEKKLMGHNNNINVICTTLSVFCNDVVLENIMTIIDTWTINQCIIRCSRMTNDVIQYLHDKSESLRIYSHIISPNSNYLEMYLPKLLIVEHEVPLHIPDYESFFELTPNLEGIIVNLKGDHLMPLLNSLKKHWPDKLEIIIIRRNEQHFPEGFLYPQFRDLIQDFYDHFHNELNIVYRLDSKDLIITPLHITIYHFPKRIVIDLEQALFNAI
ncbi:unnamed protein product [Caenorhabditis angaria]|uniref:F-box domain-containing protein n=1 Tax=Caenorhabditis angaria TaxID=860376 RepID=A0A9P1N4W6_9PELO|nr:unnamed protein product [Caenorhabditis angaria]